LVVGVRLVLEGVLRLGAQPVTGGPRRCGGREGPVLGRGGTGCRLVAVRGGRGRGRGGAARGAAAPGGAAAEREQERGHGGQAAGKHGVHRTTVATDEESGWVHMAKGATAAR